MVSAVRVARHRPIAHRLGSLGLLVLAGALLGAVADRAVADPPCVAPTVSLSTDTTTTHANAATATLTATLSGPLCGNYVGVYDESGARMYSSG
jgi:hypothetical protein